MTESDQKATPRKIQLNVTAPSPFFISDPGPTLIFFVRQRPLRRRGRRYLYVAATAVRWARVAATFQQDSLQRQRLLSPLPKFAAAAATAGGILFIFTAMHQENQ